MFRRVGFFVYEKKTNILIFKLRIKDLYGCWGKGGLWEVYINGIRGKLLKYLNMRKSYFRNILLNIS